MKFGKIEPSNILFVLSLPPSLPILRDEGPIANGYYVDFRSWCLFLSSILWKRSAGSGSLFQLSCIYHGIIVTIQHIVSRILPYGSCGDPIIPYVEPKIYTQSETRKKNINADTLETV